MSIGTGSFLRLGIIKYKHSSSELRVIWTKGYLTGLHRRVRLAMHGKVEKIGVDRINISPDNPISLD